MIRKSIINACNLVINYPLLKARGNKTYCNFGVDGILRLLGINCFWHKKKQRLMLANEMYNEMLESKQWLEIPFKDSIDNTGLVVLASEGNPHGHIAVVYPIGTCKSYKWKCVCPLVANIGIDNAIMGANWAFWKVPKAFRYMV